MVPKHCLTLGHSVSCLGRAMECKLQTPAQGLRTPIGRRQSRKLGLWLSNSNSKLKEKYYFRSYPLFLPLGSTLKCLKGKNEKERWSVNSNFHVKETNVYLRTVSNTSE